MVSPKAGKCKVFQESVVNFNTIVLTDKYVWIQINGIFGISKSLINF